MVKQTILEYLNTFNSSYNPNPKLNIIDSNYTFTESNDISNKERYFWCGIAGIVIVVLFIVSCCYGLCKYNTGNGGGEIAIVPLCILAIFMILTIFLFFEGFSSTVLFAFWIIGAIIFSAAIVGLVTFYIYDYIQKVRAVPLPQVPVELV